MRPLEIFRARQSQGVLLYFTPGCWYCIRIFLFQLENAFGVESCIGLQNKKKFKPEAALTQIFSEEA